MTNPLFKPLESNKSIENYEARSSPHKGAFTEQARDALARAVDEKRKLVSMDDIMMTIIYREVDVFIRPDSAMRFLPCGVFDYETLRDRLKVNK